MNYEIHPSHKTASTLHKYIEDFAAKYCFISLSSINGCGSIWRMLHISAGGEAAWVLSLPKIFAFFPMTAATAHFMAFATGSYIKK